MSSFAHYEPDWKALLRLDAQEQQTMIDYIKPRGWRPDEQEPEKWRKDEPYGCYIVAPLYRAYEYELKNFENELPEIDHDAN